MWKFSLNYEWHISYMKISIHTDVKKHCNTNNSYVLWHSEIGLEPIHKVWKGNTNYELFKNMLKEKNK